MLGERGAGICESFLRGGLSFGLQANDTSYSQMWPSIPDLAGENLQKERTQIPWRHCTWTDTEFLWLTGNLLAMRDGRVGFIDFGIVGRISPVTWRAVEALLASTSSRDYDTMARALVTLGATDSDVDIPVRPLFGRMTHMQQHSMTCTTSRNAVSTPSSDRNSPPSRQKES